MDDHDLKPLLDIRQNQVSILLGESNSIDTKALSIIASDLAILIFAAQADLIINNWWQGAFLIGGYILSISLAILSLWNWPYRGAGVNLEQHPEYLDFSHDDLILQLLSDTENIIDYNQRLNRRRWLFVLSSFICLSIGTLSLFAIM